MEAQPSSAAAVAAAPSPAMTTIFGNWANGHCSLKALVSWEGILVNSVTALLNGGPSGVIWGFVINWIGCISVNAVLGELASIVPTASGQCQ
jgi:amino acid transporter